MVTSTPGMVSRRGSSSAVSQAQPLGPGVARRQPTPPSYEQHYRDLVLDLTYGA